jgi:hypothetical protein
MNLVDIVVLAVGLLILPCWVAIFQQRVLAVNEAFFRMLLSPIAVAETSLQNLWGRIGQFFRQQLADEDGQLAPRNIFYTVIGSVVYTICFLLTGYADFHLICMTLASMGIEADYVRPPGGPGVITGLALFSGVLFFGTMLLDLIGVTHIAPWNRRLNPTWHRVMLIICLVALGLSITTAVLFGYWRGMAIMDDNSDPAMANYMMFDGGGLTGLSGNLYSAMNSVTSEALDPSGAWIPVAVNIIIPFLLITGGCLSGYGIVQFIKFAILGIIFLIFLPSFLLLIVLSYLSRIIDHVFNLVVSFIELAAAMGLWFLDLFGYKPPRDSDTASGGDTETMPEQETEPEEDEPFVNPFENRKDNSDE